MQTNISQIGLLESPLKILKLLIGIISFVMDIVSLT